MNHTLKNLLAPFFWPFVILITIGLYGFFVNNQLYNSLRSLERANAVIFESEKVISYLKDTETGVRGYLYARDTTFLEPFRQSKQLIGPHLAKLDSLVNANEQQKRRMETLRQLANRRIVLLDSILALAKKPDELVRSAIANRMGRDKMRMDQLRKVIDEICAAEQVQQSGLLSQKNKQSRHSKLVQWALFLLGIGVLSMAVLRMIKEFRKRMERERQLEENNREMESFSFVLAHHLQEPLRKMNIFTDRLNSKYGESLPEEGKYLTHRVYKFSNDLRRLLSGLLEITGISQNKKADFGQEVSLVKALREALSSLTEDIKSSEAVINLEEPLPVVKGNYKQLVILFAQLIQNGLKFAKPDQKPHLSVRASVVQGDREKDIPEQRWNQSFHRIVFADEGIGLDMAFKDKIFEIFQQLDKSDQSEGVGVGLAICKKIVLNHKGYITVESELGKGASFIIFLPY